MSTFKFDSQTAFLTYPQCGLEHNTIFDHLRSVGDISWARACSELHEDGQPHRHVVCKFTKRIQSRNIRLFDIQGFHPNIQPIRSIKHAIKYVSKDGEFSDIGTVPGGSTEDINWLEVAGKSTEGDYYKLACKERLPYMYAKKFWELGSKINTSEIGTDYEADISRECFELQIYLPVPGKSIVVVGPSGCGKTSWAKRVCEKPALWVRHMDVLRSFRIGYHKSIIFDEMSFKHLPNEAQINIVDQTDEAHIHCRYGYAVIPANTQKIFCGNYFMFLQDDSEHGKAIARRIYRIEVLNL